MPLVLNVVRPFFPDTTPPTTVVLDAPSVNGTSVSLSWSAATDLESGVVGYLIIVDGNAQPNLVKGLSATVSGLQAGSHTFAVAARDGAGNVAQASNTRTAQVGADITQGTKFHGGNFFWWDNQSWPGNQQTNYNAHIDSLLADPTIVGTEIALTMSAMSDPQLTNGKQTFNNLRSIIDPILAKARTRVGLPFYVVLKFWQVIFNSTNVTSSAWPQWLINKGNWLKAVTDTNGGKRVQLDYDNPAVWAALTEMHQGVGALYDADPNFEMYATADESDAVSAVLGGGTAINSVNYQNKWLQMHLDVKPSFSRTPVWVTYNYLPPGDGTIPKVMSDQIRALRAAYPGGFCFGGPDPFVRGTTFQKLVAGTAGDLGDVRGQIMLCNHIEEAFLGNVKDTTTGLYIKPANTPLQIYDNAVANKCQYLFWNYETWEYYKAADEIAAIHARAGVTAPAPSEGIFDTTPGVHA